MSVNRILLVIGLMGVIGFAWYYQSRQQDQLLASIPTEEQFALARSRASRPPSGGAASSVDTGAVAGPSEVVGSDPVIDLTTATPIPEEPEIEAPMEVGVLNKAASDQALKLFVALVGVTLEPPFALDTFSISSIGKSILKFRATSNDASQSLTILIPAQGTRANLLEAYTRDLELRSDQLRSSREAALNLIQVTDPEGGHLIAEAISARGTPYLVAWTRLGTLFNSNELAAFRTRFGR